MRHALLLLCFAICFPAFGVLGRSTDGDLQTIVAATSFRLELTWKVSRAHFESVSRWNLHREPRLSPTQAVAAARAYLRSHGALHKLPLQTIELRTPILDIDPSNPPKEDPFEGLFFYFLKFDDFHGKFAYVAVLLDGFVVPPILLKG